MVCQLQPARISIERFLEKLSFARSHFTVRRWKLRWNTLEHFLGRGVSDFGKETLIKQRPRASPTSVARKTCGSGPDFAGWRRYACGDTVGTQTILKWDMTMAAPVGLYLIVEAMPAAASIERLKAALAAARFASVLVVAAGDQKLDAGLARPFVEAIQAADAAALIDDDPQLARTLRADGVHLRPSDTLEARAKEAREILGSRYIVGAQAASRHEAMMLGEMGAEYVAFGGEDQADFVNWWAEIFEIPCVALDAPCSASAREMAKLGADFVAFRVDSKLNPADVQDQVRTFANAVGGTAAA